MCESGHAAGFTIFAGVLGELCLVAKHRLFSFRQDLATLVTSG